jgi:hypothetical protein
MPIAIDSLRSAAGRSFLVKIAKSLQEARASRQKTAFLCHSHRDEELAKGLQVLLRENGLEIYIDWQDTAMPEKPDRTTAQRIQGKIRELDWFIFLATPNSTGSRWCPWEIGYADSAKTHNSIFIVPTTDRSGTWYGNEYLQLYRQITEADAGKLAAFSAGQTSGGIWVKNL